MRWRYKIVAVDTALAACVVVLSGFLLSYTYDRLTAESMRGGLLAQPLAVGRREFAIVSHGACVGRISQDFRDESEVLHFEAEGELHVALRGIKRVGRIKTLASFNVLGQMGAGGVALTGQDFFLNVALQEIDPIKVTVTGHVGGQKFEKQLTLPGPIELQRLGLNEYRLRHGRYRVLEGEGAQMFSSFLNDKLRLSTSKWREELCKGGFQEVNLDPVADSVVHLARSLSLFTKGM